MTDSAVLMAPPDHNPLHITFIREESQRESHRFRIIMSNIVADTRPFPYLACRCRCVVGHSHSVGVASEFSMCKILFQRDMTDSAVLMAPPDHNPLHITFIREESQRESHRFRIIMSNIAADTRSFPYLVCRCRCVVGHSHSVGVASEFSMCKILFQRDMINSAILIAIIHIALMLV